MDHCMYLVKFFLFILIASGGYSIPTSKNEIEEIFTGPKRDVSSAATASLLKSPLYNPFLYPGVTPFIPGKPYFYPFLTPTDILLNRFAKSTPTALPPQTSTAGMGAYFKTKKDEFLSKLYESINNASDSFDLATRSITPAPDDDTVTKPTIDPSFFLNKKLDFLEKLFKSLNTTTVATPTAATDEVTTLKPTIVPPSFWFPFIKPPKPPKAPKPTKPPKTKKILKDALDTAILQSLLMELGIDPSNGTLSRRAATGISTAKKMKSKKMKPEEGEEAAAASEFHIPTKIDPTLYSTKASDCLDKLFKILSKADAEDLSNFIEPKATVIPSNMWTQPSDTEYTSKLDAFLDLMIKSLNATDGIVQPSGGKSSKSKKIESKILQKRSTFLDELLHRIPPSTTPNPTTESDPTLTKCKCTKTSCCCGKCFEVDETSDKSTRSLIFKPFGTGYWIPQYIYAAKMSMYLDKLMDTINTAAAEDASTESSSMKRSIIPADGKINITGLTPKDAALTLLIAELVNVKNDIVEAFADGVKAQKDAASGKSFNPAGKGFKKPFWGPKAAPTADPVESIQKRIDILTDIFDKITEVEKALLFSDDANDPKVFKSIKDSLQSDVKIGSSRLGASKFGKSKSSEKIMQDDVDSANPDYYMEKTKEFLQSLYANKMTDDNE